jgi:fimbrial chaperone protein
MTRPTPVLAAVISLGCLLSGKIQAASLEISPVIVNLAPGQTATTIEVTNRGGAPAAIQARFYAWTQAGDEDTLTPTQDIILSPPIFTVPAGASQTMRLLLRVGIVAGAERSYRLLLDEVPPANTENRQIEIALRISLPVIVASASSGASVLQWRAERGPGGEIQLTAINAGRAYAKVSAIDVTLSDGSHPKVISRGKNPYILVDANRHWTVQGSGGAAGGPLRLSVVTQAGKSEQSLVAP